MCIKINLKRIILVPTSYIVSYVYNIVYLKQPYVPPRSALVRKKRKFCLIGLDNGRLNK